jgi:hypothetical protein
MSRIRTIKPEFWSHPIIGRLEDGVKTLALALLNFADDEGYFLADPILIRNFARPFDEDSTNTRHYLDVLSNIGWIEVKNGSDHGQIGRVVNFKKHQKIDRPSASKIMIYFDSTNPRRILSDGSLLEQGTGNREQGKEIPPKPPKGEHEKQKQKRRSSKEVIQAFPEHIREIVNTLGHEWPKEDPMDGRKITISAVDFGARVSQILAEHPEITPALLLQAGQDYCKSSRNRYKAPQFFFGPGVNGDGAPWKPYVQGILTREATR